jgi:hypothetical protein
MTDKCKMSGDRVKEIAILCVCVGGGGYRMARKLSLDHNGDINCTNTHISRNYM